MRRDETRPTEHPELSDEEMRRQRGDDPHDAVGYTPDQPDDKEPEPNFVPDAGRADTWRRLADEIGKERRPRREDVYPYLLMRAFSPGDRGKRPIWPPIVCWESPDLLLIDAAYAGPFDPNRLVVTPVAGRTYRVFARVWNLGLFPAVGVHVQAWAIAAGFFGAGNQNDPYYHQHHIGGAWIDELTDRRQPDCTTIVELDPPWHIDRSESGHQCLIASVTCPADQFTGKLLSNEHRHVGQRNLAVLAPTGDAEELVGILADLVPQGFTVELTHGGPAALPLLQALGGGALPVRDGERRAPIVVPALDEVRVGVNIGASVHLLTAFEANGRTIVARSDTLQRVAARTRFGRRLAGAGTGARLHQFATAGGTRRLLDRLGPQRWDEVGEIGDQSLREAMRAGIRRILDIDHLRAGGMADALGGPRGAQHLLRFTLTTPRGELVGGYSIVVGAQQ